MKFLSHLKVFSYCCLILIFFILSQALASLAYIIPIDKSIQSLIFAGSYLVLALFAANLLSKKIFKRELTNFRVQLQIPAPFWIVIAFGLPTFVYLILYFVSPKLYLTSDIIAAICTGGIVAPIVEEVYFRGFLLTVLEEHYNRKVALFFPSFLFAALHLLNGSLTPITTILLLLAGTLVGILFSLATLYPGGTINSILVHMIWNLITSLFLFKKDTLIFGGQYGIDVSPIAILGYALAICLCITFYSLCKKSEA